jgi:ketopantoate hydroxymethyltransferase
MERKKLTPADILAMKKAGRKIATVTAYDYPDGFTRRSRRADMILVEILSG